jgi:hypothetical protein
MKGLSKHLQASFPYDELVTENRRRGPADEEYELVHTDEGGRRAGAELQVLESSITASNSRDRPAKSRRG